MDERFISRRAALGRLGLGILAAYAAPEFIKISTASAETDGSNASEASEPSAPEEPSPATEPSTSSPASEPSTPDTSQPSGAEESDWREDDTCRVHSTRGEQATIRNSDFRRAERAVQSGDAQPLAEVFRSVQQDVKGRLIEVRFSKAGVPPVYQFRMITDRGNLISVFTDASSAEILRIVSC